MLSIVLRSSDGADHRVSEQAASLSKTIKSLLQQLEGSTDAGSGSEGEQAALIVPLPNVCDCTLKKVLQYCEQHACFDAEARRQRGAALAAASQHRLEWEAAYMQVGTDELYHLVMAAHYLDVPGLLSLCCDAIAGAIRGKTAEQIRQHFSLKDNLTTTEQEDISSVNVWALS